MTSPYQGGHHHTREGVTTPGRASHITQDNNSTAVHLNNAKHRTQLMHACTNDADVHKNRQKLCTTMLIKHTDGRGVVDLPSELDDPITSVHRAVQMWHGNTHTSLGACVQAGRSGPTMWTV